MFGILYLLICLFFGTQLIRFMIPDIRRLYVGISPRQDDIAKVPSMLFIFPAGFVVGLMSVTFVTYYVALLLHRFVPNDMHVLYPANIISLCLFLYIGSLLWQKCYDRDHQPNIRNAGDGNTTKRVRQSRLPLFDRSVMMILMISFVVLAVAAAAAYISFYTLRIEGSSLLVGPSVASDFGPHIAVASSFSNGSNFPTEYPHFPGDKIQYHFFFYFLCGNLNLLGLPLDWAFNVPFILTFVATVVLLGTLAVLLSGRRLAFLIMPALVLFRSAMNIFYQLAELFKTSGSTLQSVFRAIKEQEQWFTLTFRDEWGIWAINVYANQRHLMLGISVVLILLFLFIPHVRRMFLHLGKVSGFKEKFHTFFAVRHAWIPRKSDPLHPYFLVFVALLTVVVAPFFHGSMLIGAMLILMIMAIFSENRLSYAVVALAAVGSSVLQTTLLSGSPGNVVSFRKYLGFVVEELSFKGIAEYIFNIGGLAIIIPLLILVGLPIYEVLRRRNKFRAILLLAFTAPFIFAFFFQVSVEVLANHKFIHLSILLFDVFIAGLLAILILLPLKVQKPAGAEAEPSHDGVIHTSRWVCIAGRVGGILLAVVLLVSMVGTGVSEWFVQHNKNRDSIRLNTESEMVRWIDENTHARSVFLTRNWYIHSFFLSGRMSYYGWPYYAWSAGHDTDSRLRTYEWLLTGCNGDADVFRQTCAAEGIDFVILDTELLSYQNGNGEYIVNSEFFYSNLTQVAYFPNESDARIFSVIQ
ncbi:MAG: hypothetical protein JW780_08100 [Clostridiales bacterium]|nr:hypothetical protein [Clostridiales bacterium]